MEALGHYAFMWRRRIAVGAGVFFCVAAVLAAGVLDATRPFGFSDPDSESAIAREHLERAGGSSPVPDVSILLRLPAREDNAELVLARVAEELDEIAGIARVERPEESKLITADGRTALVNGFISDSEADVSLVGERVEERFSGRGPTVAGGSAVAQHQLNQATEDDLKRIELFALPVLLALSLFAFRGLVASLIPLAAGALSVVTTLAILRLLGDVIAIDVFVVNIVSGLGAGLAIDYSLFFVTRYRDELERLGPSGAAVRATTDSIGRMVMFSGVTVAAALGALCVFPQQFLYSIGLGGAIVSVVSALTVVLVLPAILALLGERVNALAPPTGKADPERMSRARWYRWGVAMTRRPIPVAVAGIALMVAASVPITRVELTRADADALPEDASARVARAEAERAFGFDPAGALVVLAESRTLPDRAIERLDALGVVRKVRKPERMGRMTRLDALISGDPYSDSATEAVKAAREIDWGGPAMVTGATAELVDQRDSLTDHIPLGLALLITATLAALFVMTRSVLLPLLALTMNALTVGVAFGALVLIFQDGNLQELLGFESQGAIDTSIPILLFAVVFGLSTDYGVFLLYRIAEARRRGASERDAIARGVARSGRAITAAALLFAVAMGAFVFSDLVFVKELALGTALAVIVDATLVRAVILPAALRTLGRAAWWGPGTAPIPRRLH